VKCPPLSLLKRNSDHSVNIPCKRFYKDVAYALNQGDPIPESTYRAGEVTSGREGVTEVIYLGGALHLIAIILNGYDVSIPGHEEDFD
jgi:hypothetical protein